jgi:hypothetical protein
MFIDAANVANPHSVFPFIPQEGRFANVHVVQVEVLYKLRDALKFMPMWMGERGLEKMIVTTFTGLFDYGDESENSDVFEHTWELMSEMSKRYTLIVGIDDRKHMHRELVRRYCKNVVEVESDGPYSVESTHHNRHAYRGVGGVWPRA